MGQGSSVEANLPLLSGVKYSDSLLLSEGRACGIGHKLTCVAQHGPTPVAGSKLAVVNDINVAAGACKVMDSYICYGHSTYNNVNREQYL